MSVLGIENYGIELLIRDAVRYGILRKHHQKAVLNGDEDNKFLFQKVMNEIKLEENYEGEDYIRSKRDTGFINPLSDLLAYVKDNPIEFNKRVFVKPSLYRVASISRNDRY